MSSAQRITFRIALALAIVAGAATATIYAVAFVGLSNGPSIAGWDALANANHLAPVVAGLSALAVIVRTFRAKRLVIPTSGLLLASGITAGIAGGLYALGSSLTSFSNATGLDWTQPNAGLDLNSLLLGVQGSGADLAAVPIVLLIAAMLVPAISRAGRFLPSVRGAVAEAAS